MAQRLATEYVKTCLTLTEAEMIQFIQMFDGQVSDVQVRVHGNGHREILLRDNAGEEVVLKFEKRRSRYVCEGSCTVSNPKLSNLIRKAVSQFKGDAIVNRIYPAFTMNYVYKRGSVVKISEIVSGEIKLVYEYKDTVGQLERLYRQQHVELEISKVYTRINELLDERNRSASLEERRTVDHQLSKLSHKLFELEA